MRRAPGSAPRTLTTASSANSPISSSVRAMGLPATGHNTATDAVNALATDADANVALNRYSTPPRKPTNGPNATSTYAYSPPVSDTRLPAEAMQVTINAISAAQKT